MELSKRTIFEMKPVFKNRESIESDADMYLVERGVKNTEELSYDLTTIKPIKIGMEFAKTFGHYHSKLILPELYEALSGYAYSLIQRYEHTPNNIKEAYIIEAEIGWKIIVPPGFGHVSINIGDDELKLANWVGSVIRDYDPFKNLRGACYYVLDAGESIEFKKNLNYKSVPEIKKLKLRDIPELGIYNDASRPISDIPAKKLDWLAHPEKYEKSLTIKNLYREI
ncbi:hypothetical protein A3B05_03545 [Candidatus Giovannonibacteria bacterium RIFCSPLOWO2_01_FULL_43_160]|uniref:glucose-6-phosphate isomerase n=2 Tax=Parcubacteria group TaxID=1794811 RepID=A0A0G1LTT5_9BACT|nr:MAG: Glucose-6-phosphate isomerase [Candidatus Jorgensenbacteria bacterium GW2011_GWF2_41_8]KKS96387.1 MAG: Glucose-6-phosphate isomerase [Candidatus Giovannonibacteria bacterium GW2011_GWB1_43_13]KKT20981.1 MAG: Glucose-6-phosphate isomerase [Candidatus Giovannonibacteria bacterium GW2011_GWC2_43_8]KKT63134.1 MAG: Glucose-6-phosphate isomerase [Candidatus Giovannonibacteria bacterium GW2011_GWA2_44_26]OGF58195.1 MAG: hypothetical protein A2652_00450 [Candidatus Giovannonibacteria bacterium 